MTTDSPPDIEVEQAAALLTCYDFDLAGQNVQTLLKCWLVHYCAPWIRLAVLEALYLGRYKAISVEPILSSWQRRGMPTPHFTGDFERLMCRNLPKPKQQQKQSDLPFWFKRRFSDRFLAIDRPSFSQPDADKQWVPAVAASMDELLAQLEDKPVEMPQELASVPKNWRKEGYQAQGSITHFVPASTESAFL
ncbi:MAG: hypothetical protein HC890_17615 [Chloroflexaceae bacterium]|nr:hypothetical protein [Chloroflexaceae bacterium]